MDIATDVELLERHRLTDKVDYIRLINAFMLVWFLFFKVAVNKRGVLVDLLAHAMYTFTCLV